jgi:HAD superfamily hydrolase (TIGR01509 family)
MIKALLFDFDGLMVDTEWAIYQSWLELYQSFGLPLDAADWVKVVGIIDDELDYFKDIQAQTGLTPDWGTVGRLRRQRERELVSSLPALPGVLSYLEDARRLGLRLGMASTSSLEWVSEHLSQRGLLDYFECIRTRDHVSKLKPDPEPYLSVLNGMRLEASQALALEDSHPGVTSAKGAGLYCVAVPNRLTRLRPPDHADLVLDSLEDLSLEELLQRIDGLPPALDR